MGRLWSPSHNLGPESVLGEIARGSHKVEAELADKSGVLRRLLGSGREQGPDRGAASWM